MTISVEWYNIERTIIVWTFPEHFTIADFISATDASFKLAEQIDHAHCVIFDLTRNRRLPSGALAQMRTAQQRAVASPKYLFTVSVGGSRMVEELVKVLVRVGFVREFTRYVFFAADMTEAVALSQAKMNAAPITPITSRRSIEGENMHDN